MENLGFFFTIFKYKIDCMTWYLLGLLLCVIIRCLFAPPYQNELERYEDKHNWTSLGGC